VCATPQNILLQEGTVFLGCDLRATETASVAAFILLWPSEFVGTEEPNLREQRGWPTILARLQDLKMRLTGAIAEMA
jgi:hypothetical protein